MDEIYHYIEKHILRTLAFVPSARFSQMRPPRVESNLYAYHLSKLLKNNFVIKSNQNYTLTPRGLRYVDRLSFSNLRPTLQPKINTGIILKNEYDEILLTIRRRQPLLGKLGLPMGKLHDSDPDIHTAASRELHEKTGMTIHHLAHVGDCYWRFSVDGLMISNVLAHIFYKQVAKPSIQLDENVCWIRLCDLDAPNIIPGVNEIVQLALSHDSRFFAEMNFDTQMEKVAENTK
jgi:8-oxo-dGTP pyrophosphatase MutT (NUDIX family)